MNDALPFAAVAPATDDTPAFLAAVGRRVREERERRGWSRRALAGASQVSERYLALCEAGDGNVSIVLLRRVAKALGVTPASLLGDDRPEQLLVRRALEQVPPARLEELLVRLMREWGREDVSRRGRIALVGLRGAGKTTLGQALARECRAPFVELDREIERDAAVSLPELFMLHGQAGYRRAERRCLERVLAEHARLVIAVGGGIVSEPDTYRLLLDRCYTVWVRASAEDHMARVIAQGDFRPMEGNGEAMDDLKRILAAREPHYRRSDAVVDTSGATPEQSLAVLLDLVRA